ncbi:serine hydrolase domain-containing protein [Mangrovibacterium lignilyticum]|uniref:serine hydrolase domain-containing protein n=1 Tax=Mangrovibacterium lignilyticum TaxID=2668052 RepID=UPI0013D2306D|nr:serine hydrolase [Mangrovibacterium lignilyticum]
MKRRIALFVVLLIILSAGFYLNLVLPVITGYAAKNLASGVFVAGRSQESLESEDLNFSVIKFTENKVDFENKEVTSRFLWGKSTAVYIEGYGCTLVEDYTADEIRNRHYPQTHVLPTNPDSIAWPMGAATADSLPAGIDIPKLNHAVAKVMSDSIPFKGTFALMVVYKGQAVAEVYRNDFTRNTRFLGWSMGKSFVNTLVGIREKQGMIDINAPLSFSTWDAGDPRQITTNNLMHMNSGLEWDESYGTLSDVTVMLHKEGDMASYALEHDVAYPADSVWAYSSGTTNIACLALRQTFASDADYWRFPREQLFNKIGMRSAVLEMDASGTFVGSSYVYATLRDYARFGLLYLKNGNWLGEQILPDNWVSYTTTPAKGSDGNYGAFFWLNLSGDQPDAPADTYMSKGHDGQFIIIIPSKDLVVVRTGYSKKGEFSTNEMLKEILKSLE